jgi:AraC-like DNA-binding protein
MSQISWPLIAFGRILPSPYFRIKSQRHDYNELIVVIRGILYVKEPDGASLAGKAGDLLVYPAGCWHAEESDKDDPVETIFFQFKGPAGEKIRSIKDSDGRIRTLSQWIASSRQDPYPQSEQIVQAFFEAIREEFVRLEHRPAVNAAYAAIRGYVIENIERKISLAELAARVNMSKFHFIHEYKKKTGQSPMADVRRIRIEEAKNLIISTNLPLKAIASMVGMADEQQLSSSMKKYAGYPPGHFRRK